MLVVFPMCFAHFVGYAICRAENGCFGLAIQDNCAVHGLVTLPHFALRECLVHELRSTINLKCRANKTEQHIASIIKFNMPISHFCFALKQHLSILGYKVI
jgi:hypothetical protein